VQPGTGEELKAMSIRNHLKSTLLAVTAAATLLLALPSQAHDTRYRQGHHASEYRHHDRHHDRHRGHDRHGGYRHEHYRARNDYGHPPRHAGQQQVWHGSDRHWDGDRDGRRDNRWDEHRRHDY